MTFDPDGQREHWVAQREPGMLPRQPRMFRNEVRTAVRYERGLVMKAFVVLAVLAVIVLLRLRYSA